MSNRVRAFVNQVLQAIHSNCFSLETKKQQANYKKKKEGLLRVGYLRLERVLWIPSMASLFMSIRGTDMAYGGMIMSLKLPKLHSALTSFWQ